MDTGRAEIASFLRPGYPVRRRTDDSAIARRDELAGDVQNLLNALSRRAACRPSGRTWRRGRDERPVVGT